MRINVFVKESNIYKLVLLGTHVKQLRDVSQLIDPAFAITK